MEYNKISKYKDDIENYEDVEKITDFENFFNVYTDEKRNCLTFNLNSTIYLNINKDQLNSSTINHSTYWPYISYMIYNTPRLAWLLMKLNNVKAKDMFNIILPGTTIYYINTELMQNIIGMIN